MQTQIKPIMIDANQVLKKLEDERIRIQNKPDSQYPKDYTVRLCESVIAELAGYKTRAEWEGLVNHE